jgi:tRNA (guanine26-N2/guanine27-N2)-dimethyltransferase
VGERGPAKRAAVFYNPAMALDRDLGVAFARAWRRLDPTPKRGWEMLAATGIRGLRLLHESGRFQSMLSTERNGAAYAVLRENVARYAGEGATAANRDAREVPEGAPFDYVDLDPYGSPLPFLAPAIHAVKDGGVLGVTATDMMVLAGVEPGAAERKYGSRPLRGRLAPEAGLRILLASVARRARESRRRMVPWLAYVLDHHVRAYVQFIAADSEIADPIRKIDPEDWDGPRLPRPGPWGPFWLGPLLNAPLVATLEPPTEPADAPGVQRWIETWGQETLADRPFYYESNELARTLGLSQPPPVGALASALRARGFAVARTQVRTGAFRTTAPRGVVEEIARNPGPARHSQNARVRA